MSEKEWVFAFMKAKDFTKDFGKMISDMEKDLSGFLMATST
jgi:hypothetical protein